jgi:hypothetical protein
MFVIDAPSDKGDNIWSPVLAAPALCPNNVTLPGSPPKAAIFSCTNFIAKIWSCMPRFPGATSSPVDAKPSIEDHCFTQVFNEEYMIIYTQDSKAIVHYDNNNTLFS